MTGNRIEALDVLRGAAIAGTLGTNIWIFTSPGGPADLAGALGQAGALESFLRFLANGKFLALLTLLFGVGLELQYRSARRRGLRWPGRYLWRAALLFAEGLLHYVLVFEYDVLMGYGVTAIVVAYLIGRSDRVVTAWMAAVGSLFVLFVGLATAALLYSGASLAGSSPGSLFTEGSYLDQVASRIELAGVYRAEAVFIVPLGVVLFLLGARLLRAGVFDGTERGAALRRRLMAIGLGAGLPLNLVTTFAGPGWFLVDRYLLPPLVALGLLALITSLVRRDAAPGPLRRGLSNVGRTALSCYVFQNVVASALCYGWGLGLAARLDWLRPWWVPVAWLAICALFMALSTLWLRRFSRGPIEAAWQWAYQLPWRSAPAPARSGSA
ncbi:MULTISPECIES: DUF418 domain-containing protein [Nonomuraea]|uniref:DUF418 domain-containing protein n=1 Tax=Nonomuraea ferruginea TaxID=46174 RepID=A0ABT4T3C8_9ACTN|nr:MULTISPECIES: DUF418 domain-containing protein [Nonomuraea]MDA0643640.1 DUF418 domain-containing protein [Nonomuraea ferruginea]TXK39414.1 DUF418 domain-containing protein [Nonomuraea sp. C10]